MWIASIALGLTCTVRSTGVPVFAMGAAGLPWIFGPTGGYLMSFPIAAATVGLIAGREGGLVRMGGALLAATLVIFLMGSGWLAVVTDSSSTALFAIAVLPFLVGAMVKAAIALVVARQILERNRRA